MYYSDIVGEYIKDAITGVQYPYRVGTKGEESFFRVVITTTPTSQARSSVIGRGVHKAFYDSPHSYMKHHNCVLDEEFVENWYEQRKDSSNE